MKAISAKIERRNGLKASQLIFPVSKAPIPIGIMFVRKFAHTIEAHGDNDRYITRYPY